MYCKSDIVNLWNTQDYDKIISILKIKDNGPNKTQIICNHVIKNKYIDILECVFIPTINSVFKILLLHECYEILEKNNTICNQMNDILESNQQILDVPVLMLYI